MYVFRREIKSKPQSFRILYIPLKIRKANLMNQASFCGFEKIFEDVRVPSTGENYEKPFHLHERSLTCAINEKWGSGNSKVDTVSSETVLINGC